MKRTYLLRMVFNFLSLIVIVGAMIMYYQGGSFSLPVQIMVGIAVVLAIVSGYFRLKH